MPKNIGKRDEKLKDLVDYLRSNTKAIAKSLESKSVPRGKNNSIARDKLGESQENFQKNRSAKVIQHAWRNWKVKEAVVKSPYFFYLSLIDPQDEQKLLSSVMFGRHVAEIVLESSDYRIDNPWIHPDADYHREEGYFGEPFNQLKKFFPISKQDELIYDFIPVSLLHTLSIEEVLNVYLPDFSRDIKVLECEAIDTVALLGVLKKDENRKDIETVLSAAGLIASPWDIAINAPVSDQYLQQAGRTELDANLPNTKESLLQSKIIGKLNAIALSERHPTHNLARCLQKLLGALPELSPTAVQRVALMLDMSNTFYEYNYPRYAFCVYTIIHEISLSLLNQINPAMLNKSYEQFLDEAQKTLIQALGLEGNPLENTMFIAIPAMSGTHAYTMAMKLAGAMKTESGEAPSIRVITPSYFEFDYLTKGGVENNADIFIISAGPVMGDEGIEPGTDINDFVRNHIIKIGRQKPTTIVVDATSALYKNIKLEPDVSALVEQGKLSIIIHESHQKFGLIHTDQAQYGRMFALCSIQSFENAVFQAIQDDAKVDFEQRIDMRIGAFISAQCGEILEEIKSQHFTNGALLRNILVQTELVAEDVLGHEDMLKNLDELYFLNAHKDNDNLYLLLGDDLRLANARDSFGHFETVVATIVGETRVSPDASDAIDSLVLATQIYLSYNYNEPGEIYDIFRGLVKKITLKSMLPLEYQLMMVAVINILAVQEKEPYLAKRMGLPLKQSCRFLSRVLDLCPLLKGRQYFLKAKQALLTLSAQVDADEKAAHNLLFFSNTVAKHGLDQEPQVGLEEDDFQAKRPPKRDHP